MAAADDRWDVMVVGLRDPSQAGMVMAVAELAHYASLPPDEVQRRLDEGEVPVLFNLDRAEAERAAHELHDLGALVDLRLTPCDDGVFPVFKPDAERQIGVAVGGLIDDSATPPTVGHTAGHLPELEPDPEVPAAPRSRPRPKSAGRRRADEHCPAAVERPVTSARGDTRAADVDLGPAAVDRGGRSWPPETEDLDSLAEPVRPASGPQGAPRSAATRDPGLARSGSGMRDAVPSAVARERGTGRPGSGARDAARARGTDRSASGPRAVARPGSGARDAARSTSARELDPGAKERGPRLPARFERAVTEAQQDTGSLELDFEAVGLSSHRRASTRTTSPFSVTRQAATMPRRTRRGAMGGTGASAAGRPPPPGDVRSTLRHDRWVARALGLNVGLLLSLVLAVQLQRHQAQQDLPALEQELALSLSDPAGMEGGLRRSADAIEDELDAQLDRLEQWFFVVWLVAGTGGGLVLARLGGGLGPRPV